MCCSFVRPYIAATAFLCGITSTALVSTNYLGKSLLVREQPYWASIPVLASGFLCLVYCSFGNAASVNKTVSCSMASFKCALFALCFASFLAGSVAAYYSAYRAYDIGTYAECLECPAFSTRCPSEFWSPLDPSVSDPTVDGRLKYQAFNCMCVIHDLKAKDNHKFKITRYYKKISIQVGCDAGVRTILWTFLLISSVCCAVGAVACFLFSIVIYQDYFRTDYHQRKKVPMENGSDLSSVGYHRVDTKSEAENTNDLTLSKFDADSSQLQRFETIDDSILEIDNLAMQDNEATESGVNTNNAASTPVINSDEATPGEAIAKLSGSVNAAKTPKHSTPILMNGRSTVHPETESPASKPSQYFSCGSGGIYEEILSISSSNNVTNQSESKNRATLDDLLFNTAEFILKSDISNRVVNIGSPLSNIFTGAFGKNQHCKNSGLFSVSDQQGLLVEAREFWV